MEPRQLPDADVGGVEGGGDRVEQGPVAIEAKATVAGEGLSGEEITLADPEPGEVAVDLAACAICHSDITYADGGWGP